MEEKIVNVINEMADVLNVSQLKKLQEVMLKHFADNAPERNNISSEEYLIRFITAKQIEGCSERTIAYYKSTVEHYLDTVHVPVRKISTETIRQYLIDYQSQDY